MIKLFESQLGSDEVILVLEECKIALTESSVGSEISSIDHYKSNPVDHDNATLFIDSILTADNSGVRLENFLHEAREVISRVLVSHGYHLSGRHKEVKSGEAHLLEYYNPELNVSIDMIQTNPTLDHSPYYKLRLEYHTY